MSISHFTKMRVGIIGLGNCASALLQGLEYYKTKPTKGLMKSVIGGYTVEHIEVVLAFDVDRRKVGQTIQDAIYLGNNCCYKMVDSITNAGPVLLGPVLDGVAPHMQEPFQVSHMSPVAETPQDMALFLSSYNLDILVNYLPVGSQKATEFWAETCLAGKIAFMNCMPIFIASDLQWSTRFAMAGLPCIGDDIKSQFGASILSQMLEELAIARGHKVVYHVQQNTGGNTDFLNMTAQDRLVSKKISKENVIRSQHVLRSDDVPFVHAGPSDYVPVYQDTKIAHIDLQLEGFGGSPVSLDVKLKVQDSPNSAGVVIDALRYLQTAKDLGLSGSLLGASAFLCKHPALALPFETAQQQCDLLARRCTAGLL